MGPLVYYCRWQGAKLRLQGREGHWVWGFLVYEGESDQRSAPFRFDTQSLQLYLGGDEVRPPLQLDEMGVVVSGDDG